MFEKSVFAVGPRTANAARKVGFLKIIEGNVGGQALTSVIRNSILGTRLGVKPLKPLLWPSAEHIGYDMVGALAPFHIPVIRVPVYRMAAEENFSPLARSALNTGSVRAIIAMSERTATIFTHLIEKSSFHTKIGDISLIVSGQKIAKAAGNGWREVFVAQRPHRCRLMAIAVLRYRRDLAEQRNQ